VIVWGVLFFGGFTFITDIFIKGFIRHEALNTGAVAGIAMEKLLGGIFWGSTMWFLFPGGKRTSSDDEKRKF